MGNQKILLKLDHKPSMPVRKIYRLMLATSSVYAHKRIIHALWDNFTSRILNFISLAIIKYELIRVLFKRSENMK